jgi:hypothetical protein
MNYHSLKTKFRQLKDDYGIDGVIVGIAGMTLSVSLYLLVFDGGFFEGETDNLTPVGQFASSQNDVRRRVDSGFAWSSVASRDRVFEGDSIFTGDESEASIDLDQGGKIIIDPKSLIVIRTSGGLQLDLQYGSMTGKVKKGDTLVVKTADGTAQEIKGDDAEIRLTSDKDSGGEMKIEVIKGEVEVKGQKVRQNEVAELKKDGKAAVQKVEVALVAPASNQLLWLPPGEKLNLQWSRTGAAASLPAVLEVSRDPNFKSILFTTQVDGNSHELSDNDRPAGYFFWRVRPDTEDPQESIPSNPRRLTVFIDAPPSPVAPSPEQSFLLDAEKNETSRPVIFGWEDKSGSTSYRLEVARDDGFIDIVYKNQIGTAGDRSIPLTEGLYHWRVMGIHKDRSNPPWSQVSTFSIKEGFKAPKPPQLADLKIDYVIPKAALAKKSKADIVAGESIKAEGVKSLAWSSVNGAKGYEVEISSNESFSDSVKKAIGPETNFALDEVKPGPVFVRIRAKGENGALSEPSQVARMDIMVPPPALADLKTKVSTFKTETAMKKGKHEFKVQWAPQPYAASYELMWGSDPEFTRAKRFKVEKPEREIAVSQAMDYSVKVRALDAKGRPISEFSEVKTVSYKKELEPPPPVIPVALPVKPDPAPPAPASLPVDSGIARTDGSVAGKSRDPASRGIPGPTLLEPSRKTSLITLESSTVFVNFRWRPDSKASSYDVQIAEDADFSKILEQVSVKSTRYVFQRRLPEGKVFWRVRAKTKKGPSDWSDVYDLNVLYE